MGTMQTIMQGLKKLDQVLPEKGIAEPLSDKGTISTTEKPTLHSLHDCLTKLSPPQLVKR